MNKIMAYIRTMADQSEKLSWQQAIEKAIAAILKDNDFLKYWHYILLGSIDAKRKGIITDDAALFHICQAAGKLCEEILDQDYLLNHLMQQMQAIEKREGLTEDQSFSFPESYNNIPIPDDWEKLNELQGDRLDKLDAEYMYKILLLYGQTTYADMISLQKGEYEQRFQAGGKQAYEPPDRFVQKLNTARERLPKKDFLHVFTAEWRIEKAGSEASDFTLDNAEI